MSNVKSVIGTCIFALILTEVTTWTIDLPEVRRFYFERNQYKHGDENKIYFNRQPNLVKYNNIYGNSLHNTPLLNKGVNGGEYGANDNYAGDYGYYTYMEKKVHSVFHKGTIYLEGLQRAMERYAEQLNNCSKLERSRPQTNRTWVPETESPLVLSGAELRGLTCDKVTEASERVRRLSSLIVWAIRELQDIAYAKDYDKDTKESDEDVLLLQLAWALDELARLTGFEPDPSEYATTPTPATAPPTTPSTYFNLPIPNDGPTMADCIKRQAPAPATARCAVPIPDVVLQFLNITNSSLPVVTTNSSQSQDMMNLLTMFQNSGSGRGQQSFAGMPRDAVRQQMLDCLTGSNSSSCFGFQSFLTFLNDNSPLQQPGLGVQPRVNRETDSSELEILEAAEHRSVAPLRKSRRKRSANEPLKEFAQFYVKYKAWSGANPATEPSAVKSDSFDVKNDLTAVKVRKRSVIAEDGIVARIPEDPMQDLSYFAKHKTGVNYNKASVQAEKVKAYLKKLSRSDIGTAKNHVLELADLIKSVHKRSVHYTRLHRPRVPEDPMQDLSYYVKNKPGTNARPDPAHAARVRLGLQEIFERGNIAVVRRYGSNYVPGVQPLVKGQIESFTDF